MTAAGQSRLTPRPRQPVPAQRSSTRGVSTPASIPAAASATTSVSARGQSTPGPTASSKSRKGQLPQRYCKGSRAARRRVSASSLAASSASSGRSVSRASPACGQPEQLPGVEVRVGTACRRQTLFHFPDGGPGQHPFAHHVPSSGFSGKTGVTAAMATSIMLSSGSKTVSRCTQRPGWRMMRVARLSERPHHFSSS